MSEKAEHQPKGNVAAQAEPAPVVQRRAPSIRRVLGALLAAVALLTAYHVLPWSIESRMACWTGHKAASVPEAQLTVEERVDKILASTPLIDGHNDFPMLVRYLYNNHIYDDDFRKAFEEGGLPMHVDVPRMRAGKNGGVFWSVYVACPKNGSDLSDENYVESVRDTFQQLDLVNRLRDVYPDVFSPVVNSSDALAAFEKGQLISPSGVEGLHQIGNSVTNLRLYHALGARYVTLNHNCPNIYSDAALWEGPLRKAPKHWDGLSPAGRKLVHEMNRIGLIVDLSHTSVDTMEDVLGGRPDKETGWTGALAPAIFSHSSAYSVCPHPRNVPDHVLKLVKATGSLVMVNFAPQFVSCHWTDESENGIPTFYPANNTLEHVATHILHIADQIGFEHVGLGSDFDGIPTTPKGLESVADFPALIAELLRRGTSDADAALVAGGNLLRVWKNIDAVAERLQAEGMPALEDDLPNLKFDEENR